IYQAEVRRLFRNKLNMPRVGSNIVRRKKIEEKLRLLPEYKFAFLSAPAGYGKTTAVVDYLTRADIKHAWLSIDEADNDPVRFWKYLTASLSGCLDEVGIARLSIDEELVSSNVTVDLLIDALENIPESFVLILDDCHLIENETILRSIEYFVRYLPRNAGLIMMSRKEPENMLSLLRARGTAISLGARDIAFDYEETAEFFAQKGFHLTEDEIRTLARYTEGWAAGLVAASFSIRENEDISDAVSALSGKDKNIAVILEKDVFARWPQEVRDFLIQTSFLDRLSGPLCAAVTGNVHSAELLKQLCESNSFVAALDSENHFFRYHHLFREYLLRFLEQEDEETRRGLYGKAGAWCLQNGEITRAVNFLLMAGEFEAAYPQILNYRAKTRRDNNYSLFKKWVESIPERLYADDPTIYVSCSWVSSMENQPQTAQEWSDKARTCFERIKSGLAEAQRDALEAQVLFADLNVAIREMDAERVFKNFGAISKLNLSEPVALGDLNWNEPSLLKTAYGFSGRLSLVERYLSIIDSLPKLVGNFAAYAAVIVAEFYYERNRLTELADILVKNMGSITEMQLPGIIVPTFILLAKSKRARGDIAGAFHDIEEARKLLADKSGSVWSYHLDIFTAALYLSIGDLDRAAGYLGAGRIGLYDTLSAIREFEYIVYARYLMRSGRPDDALILLGRLTDFARKENQLGSQIELLCLEAVCHAMKDDKKSAVPVLEQALALGMEEGYVRIFVDEGEPMAALLTKYVHTSRGRKGKYLVYARSLLRSTGEYVSRLKRTGEKARSGKPPSGLASLLTDREIEVLRLLAQKKSNQEIADQLFFSLSAVKQCNTRIYDKLGVKNRLEAIEKASELGLTE
ncbi:MAG TPA: LuxR C-terminal-related transcriptional regulator, partial [Negativicutes bacterium]|nr:LuxR C-terminal-related transcriptional regulator [Negativicutes bacterium]